MSTLWWNSQGKNSVHTEDTFEYFYHFLCEYVKVHDSFSMIVSSNKRLCSKCILSEELFGALFFLLQTSWFVYGMAKLILQFTWKSLCVMLLLFTINAPPCSCCMTYWVQRWSNCSLSSSKNFLKGSTCCFACHIILII